MGFAATIATNVPGQELIEDVRDGDPGLRTGASQLGSFSPASPAALKKGNREPWEPQKGLNGPGPFGNLRGGHL